MWNIKKSITVQQFNTDIRKHFYTVRAVDQLNNLPNDIRATLNHFKKYMIYIEKQDKHNWCSYNTPTWSELESSLKYQVSKHKNRVSGKKKKIIYP